MVIKSPCYDVISGMDCSDRELCKLRGRSACAKWKSYESMYASNLNKINENKKHEAIYRMYHK